MTDTFNDFVVDEENDSQVLQWYKRSMAEIRDIDEVLDAGSEAAGKRKYTSELVSKFEDSWKPVAEKLNTQLAAMRDAEEFDRVVGLYTGLIRAIQKDHKEFVENYVTKQVDSQPKAEDKTSDEEKQRLAKERSDLAKQVGTLIAMAKNFGEIESEEDWPKPKRRGAVGKRGPRALSLYHWNVDGVDLEGDDDNQTEAAKLAGFEKSSALTAALKDAKIDTTNPPAEFTAELNGHVIVATRESEEEEVEEETSEENQEV